MKKLTLTGKLQRRLSRLDTEVSELYFRGVDPHNLADKVCVAVVGSRKMTPYGRELTEKIVSVLVGEGVIIISGLAFGVDITAHKAALAAGGQTIAVLPSDITHIYPATHRSIAEEITETGALVSEYADNPRPQPYAFLERNRIIAALSNAVFIPEAAGRSGSLNTAWHAHTMKIPVFAAPGRTIDSLSAGTNKLIATDKATIVTHSTDILKRLAITAEARNTNHQKSLSALETTVLDALQSGICETDYLQKELSIDTPALQTALTMLEIGGFIQQNELGQWKSL